MATRPKSEVEERVYEMQARICKAFAHPTRLRLLDLIAQRELTVSELQAELGISTANVSQHLAVLRSAGVAATRREGKQIYCSIALPEVKSACSLIRDVLRAQVRSGNRLKV
jgi:ArsR family transcriptional regulator